MNKRALRLVSLFGMAVLPLLFPRSADAGAASSASPVCVFNADGSGYCTGSLLAFRNSSDPTAQLTLQQYTDSTNYITRYFYLTYGGTTKYVGLNSTAANLTSQFDHAAVAVNAQIWFHWNASTQCDGIQFWNASYYL